MGRYYFDGVDQHVFMHAFGLLEFWGQLQAVSLDARKAKLEQILSHSRGIIFLTAR
jgi:ATP-dependent DNA ligase